MTDRFVRCKLHNERWLDAVSEQRLLRTLFVFQHNILNCRSFSHYNEGFLTNRGLLLFPRFIDGTELNYDFWKRRLDAIPQLARFMTYTFQKDRYTGSTPVDKNKIIEVFWRFDVSTLGHYDEEESRDDDDELNDEAVENRNLWDKVAGQFFPKVMTDEYVILEFNTKETSIPSDLMKTFMLDHLGEKVSFHKERYVIPLHGMNDEVGLTQFMRGYIQKVKDEVVQDIPSHVHEYLRSLEKEKMLQTEKNLKRKAEEAMEIEEQRRKSRKLAPTQEERCHLYTQGCRYEPFDGEDWCDHSHEMYYGLENEGKCFDLSELLNHVELTCLGAEKYGNPYPQYPYDPFDRRKFTETELTTIADLATQKGIIATYPKFQKFVIWLLNQPQSVRNDMLMLGITPRQMESVINNINQSGGSKSSIFHLMSLIGLV